RPGRDRVRMLRRLVRTQGRGACAEGFASETRAQTRPLPLAAGGAAGQVGQREGGRAVAAVDGAEQRIQRGVLLDRDDRAVAVGPVPGREVESEQLDLADVGFAHPGVLVGASPLSPAKARRRPSRYSTAPQVRAYNYRTECLIRSVRLSR